MIPTLDLVDAAVTAAAGKCGGQATRANTAAWRVELVNGRCLDVAASVDTGREWLRFDADTETAGDPAARWRALTLTGSLREFSKVALAASNLRLRAEVPLDRVDLLPARTAAICSAFKHALAALHQPDCGGEERAASDALISAEAHTGLASGCRAHGWNAAERSNGTLVVDLDCPGRFYQAMVEPLPNAGVSVTVDIVRRTLSMPCRDAMSRLLLASAAVLRLARAAAGDEHERSSLRFEVVFDAPPDESDLDHAFSALSAACNMAGDEARALQDENVARRYLEAMADH